jgi:hypothetical protein
VGGGAGITYVLSRGYNGPWTVLSKKAFKPIITSSPYLCQDFALYRFGRPRAGSNLSVKKPRKMVQTHWLRTEARPMYPTSTSLIPTNRGRGASLFSSVVALL